MNTHNDELYGIRPEYIVVTKRNHCLSGKSGHSLTLVRFLKEIAGHLPELTLSRNSLIIFVLYQAYAVRIYVASKI